MARRRQNFQNVAWFWDIKKRGLLDMDPPYQRRSVWNQQYQESFVDTILLDYPAPAIFLFSRVDESGVTKYELVDGKQRLTAVFQFLEGKFQVGEKSEIVALRGSYFEDLTAERKLAFYEYDFPLEYLPTNEESVVNNIFDRLNRNVAKLSNQELRHAKYSGNFMVAAEELTEWSAQTIGSTFPRIQSSSRRQMKDVEITASLLLFLEIGPRRLSVLEMDEAFSDRDEEWENESQIVAEFKSVVETFTKMTKSPNGEFILGSRFKNQADYYSLFGAIAELQRQGTMPDINNAVLYLDNFNQNLDNPSSSEAARVTTVYLDAARSGSHDTNQRKIRISITKHILAGRPIEDWTDV